MWRVFAILIYMNRFQTFLRKHRPLCVAYEALRYAGHKILGWGHQTTPVWYQFDQYPTDTDSESQPMDKNWYHIARPLYRHEHVFYNLQNALKTNPHVKGFAFIFFMGIGDYLYTTPVWGELKKKFPHIPFYGYVGAQFDRNNSPLVGKLLSENPHFDKVFYFNGSRHPLIWKNYDYEEALSQIPEGFLAVPVYYEYGLQIPHRVSSVFETFGLPVPQKPPRPVMYFPQEPAPVVAEHLQQVQEKANGKKGIVFLQLDSRGSNYVYPQMRELAEGLIARGYYVMSVTKGGPTENADYLEIDIKKFTINQTWHLLSLLKQEFPLYVIAVNSVFWAASAGLNLPNLGLQHWIDKKVHNLWYPNIEVVTDYLYPLLPREKQIFAPPESYTPHNKKIIDYKPEWVIKWFVEKFEK